MAIKKETKRRVWGAIFGCFLVVMGLFTGVTTVLGEAAYAEPVTSEGAGNGASGASSGNGAGANETSEEEAEEETAEAATPAVTGASCEDSLGALGWWVCPNTGKIAEAADWLYERIEGILVINPVEMRDGSPIFEIWKYFRGITNIVFIIFLLVMVYSQLTGVGITNYGLKKMLPKLIIAAILVNLSFIICSLAVDVSNIIGNSLRGVFSSISEAAFSGMTVDGSLYLSLHDMYGALAGGSVLAIAGGAIALETGAIWMLIPVVLGAIVAIASGLITIAMRQAVVALLIMIAPLAIVAYILPNTDQWFKKWRQLLTKMLVFYPMFSLLFGASQLAGFAIIAASTDGFGVMLGMAVQIFPLFFSWSLMKMSGTFLSSINARLTSLAARPLATNRGWAESHRDATRMKYLASNNTYLPGLRLRQFLSDRKVAREEETKENATTVQNRGLAYGVRRNYKDFDKGVLSADGERAYEEQARNMRYQRTVDQHKHNMNEGYAARVEKGTAHYARLAALDRANVNASDFLKAETARGEMIDYRNAVGYHSRMEAAINAHMDDKNGYILNPNTNELEKKDWYEFHFEKGSTAYNEAAGRYDELKKIMNGSELDTQYSAAYAAHAYDTQAKIITSKFQKYFELTPPTRDVRYRLEEFSQFKKQLEDGTFQGKAVDNIDAIISGLRILNQRGDTDFVKNILDDVLDPQYGGLTLGTHASQAVASFLMFDVKDNDPWLRRFGKYINLETARVFDKNQRQKTTVDYEEYVKGYHIEPDGKPMYAKKDMVKLMEGTSLDGIERTALDNYDKSLRKAYTDENGVLDLEAYEKRRLEVDSATAPQFISANLKYLSGSEQIASAVKSKTGFVAKQDKETGKYSMVPIWEDEAEELFNGYETEADKVIAKDGLEKWYRNQTLQYLKDQTPAQILGLRSDYKEPLLEHLSKAYLEDSGRAAKHNAKIREIDERYADLDPEEAEKLRKSDKDALRMAEAGEAFRELLHSKGKLEQIEKSKRSGAANNAKDWVRELLLLDSNNGLQTWLLQHPKENNDSGGIIDSGTPSTGGGQTGGGAPSVNENQPTSTPTDEQVLPDVPKKITNSDRAKSVIPPEVVLQRLAQKKAENERKRMMQEQVRKILEELNERKKREGDANLTPDRPNVSVYDADAIGAFQVEIERIWYDVRDNNAGNEYAEFYEAAHESILQWLTPESYVVKTFEKYYKDNPNGESHDMREYLKELLKTLLED